MRIHCLLSSYTMISDFSYNMNQLAWGIILFAFVVVILISIWNALRKPLSKYMKVKQVKAEVLHVQNQETNGYGLNQKVRKSVARTSITVRFLEPKKRGRKTFFMNASGINEGDIGMFTYQGSYGIGFEIEGSLIKDATNHTQNYGFQKEKEKRAEEQQQKNATRKNRKYW